jgi:two-component system, NarL family, response regulator DesR
MADKAHAIRERIHMRTILAECEAAVRDALRVLLTQNLDMQVVGEADTVGALQRQVQEQRPDLLVVDWELVAAESAVTLAGMRRSCPGLRIVVLGVRPEVRAAALASGADAFICTVDAPDVVVRALGFRAGRPAGSSP